MDKERIVLQSYPLCCVHIGEADANAIRGFRVTTEKGGFLAGYLKRYAYLDEQNGKARTYLIYDMDTDELVAYFSIKAGFVSVNESKGLFQRRFDAEPGAEISNLAINGAYREKYGEETKGIGADIFRTFILPIAQAAAMHIGVRILYIFALPYDRLISHYEKLGFIRLNKIQEREMHRRIKPRYDRGCIFMYQVI